MTVVRRKGRKIRKLDEYYILKMILVKICNRKEGGE
jgi:hypothetical protein